MAADEELKQVMARVHDGLSEDAYEDAVRRAGAAARANTPRLMGAGGFTGRTIDLGPDEPYVIPESV